MRALNLDPFPTRRSFVRITGSSPAVIPSMKSCRPRIASVSLHGASDAAFVQAMYEEYLRDPNSVGQEWRERFEKRRDGRLPLVPAEPSPAPARRLHAHAARSGCSGTPAPPPAPPISLNLPHPPPPTP